MSSRRAFLAWLALSPGAALAVDYPAVVPGRPLAFPRDHGRHADFRTEWWYVTGWIADAQGRDYGVQVTFFRNRPGVAEGNRSRFAARELLFAHAALADPGIGRLRHDQRAARTGFGLASAADETTRVAIGDWSLALDGDTYRARVAANGFALDLAFAATDPPLLQGELGYSRKGPDPAQASYYYSVPQLAASGRVEIAGRGFAVEGRAWLDHEWSSEPMARDAVGWDWSGIDLDDGGALMAFRMRDRSGGALWAGGALRPPGGPARTFGPGEVRFTPLRRWTSARTGVTYPVSFRVDAGDASIELRPLFDDQELDSRASTGTIYWEGAVRALAGGREVGRGYLELTGYASPLVL